MRPELRIDLHLIPKLLSLFFRMKRIKLRCALATAVSQPPAGVYRPDLAMCHVHGWSERHKRIGVCPAYIHDSPCCFYSVHKSSDATSAEAHLLRLHRFCRLRPHLRTRSWTLVFNQLLLLDLSSFLNGCGKAPAVRRTLWSYKNETRLNCFIHNSK